MKQVLSEYLHQKMKNPRPVGQFQMVESNGINWHRIDWIIGRISTSMKGFEN
jgi:hypothetical protein